MYGTKLDVSVRIGPVNLRDPNEATLDIILLLQTEAYSVKI